MKHLLPELSYPLLWSQPPAIMATAYLVSTVSFLAIRNRATGAQHHWTLTYSLPRFGTTFRPPWPTPSCHRFPRMAMLKACLMRYGRRVLDFTYNTLYSSHISLSVQIMDSPVLPRPSRDQLRRLSIKMAAKHGKFPQLLVLQGVQCTDSQQYGAGAFADVFRGTYEGSKVGLKRLRVYLMMSDTEREVLKKVRFISLDPLPLAGDLILSIRSHFIASRFYGNAWSTHTFCSS